MTQPVPCANAPSRAPLRRRGKRAWDAGVLERLDRIERRLELTV